MNVRPLPDSTMASICEESTSRGMAKASGGVFLSISRASVASVGGSCWSLFSISDATMRFFRISSALVWMSFHITNLLNEKMPSIDSSMTFQRFCCSIARRKYVKIFLTSTPLSSFGRTFRASRLILKFCFSNSTSVIFSIVSSSRLRMM